MYTTALAQAVNNPSILDIVIALTAIVTVIVSLITAVTSTKQSAFSQLKMVVDDMKMELQQERATVASLRKDLIEANERADDFENQLRSFRRYNRRLIRQLINNKIEPEKPEEDTKDLPPKGE